MLLFVIFSLFLKVAASEEIEGENPELPPIPARTYPPEGCLNYMTPKKRSLGAQVVYSLATTAAFMENI